MTGEYFQSNIIEGNIFKKFLSPRIIFIVELTQENVTNLALCHHVVKIWCKSGVISYGIVLLNVAARRTKRRY